MRRFVVLVVLLFVLLVGAGVAWFTPSLHELIFGPRDFSGCTARFGVVQKTYPRQCVTSFGTTFTEIIPPDIPKSEIALFSNLNELSSPYTFEASITSLWLSRGPLLLTLKDAAGNTLATSSISVQGQDISEYTPVQVTFTFVAQPRGGHGFLTVTPAEVAPVDLPVTYK